VHSGQREIRVIDDEGNQLAFCRLTKRLRKPAKESDLVEISPTAQLPVCPSWITEVSLPAGKERARSQEASEDDHRKEVVPNQRMTTITRRRKIARLPG
jgi:hypothetical protein